MSTGRVARSEALLQTISRKVGISEDGKQWLIAALDPFHDNPIHCNGFPDNRSDASVVQCIKQSLQISCPAGITTGTWDCHFTSYPWVESNTVYNNTDLSSGGTPVYTVAGSPVLSTLNAASLGAGTIGGVGVFSCQTGTKFGVNPSATAVYTPLGVAQSYLVGAVRVIACGFEVVNTTSPLNVQGLCTVWKSPVTDYSQNSMLPFGYSGGTGTSVQGGTTAAWIFPGPPSGITNAMLLAESRQWHAKEGAYVIPALSSTNIPLQYELAVTPVMIGDYPLSGQSGLVGVVGALASFKTTLAYPSAPPGDQYVLPNINTYSNFNLAGAIFTGLSLSTTLTLTYHVYVERFPAFEAPDLVVLATPSPNYDPQALELYSAVSQHMPPGVMVRDNGLGDWFQSAIGFAKDVISPVLSVIPHPVAQVANAALKGVSGVNDAIKNRQGNSAIEQIPRPMIKAAAAKKKPAVRTNRALELRIAAAKKKMGK